MKHPLLLTSLLLALPLACSRDRQRDTESPENMTPASDYDESRSNPPAPAPTLDPSTSDTGSVGHPGSSRPPTSESTTSGSDSSAPSTWDTSPAGEPERDDSTYPANAGSGGSSGKSKKGSGSSGSGSGGTTSRGGGGGMNR